MRNLSLSELQLFYSHVDELPWENLMQKNTSMPYISKKAQSIPGIHTELNQFLVELKMLARLSVLTRLGITGRDLSAMGEPELKILQRILQHDTLKVTQKLTSKYGVKTS